MIDTGGRLERNESGDGAAAVAKFLSRAIPDGEAIRFRQSPEPRSFNERSSSKQRPKTEPARFTARTALLGILLADVPNDAVSL